MSATGTGASYAVGHADIYADLEFAEFVLENEH
jgi:hypothetical protein